MKKEIILLFLAALSIASCTSRKHTGSSIAASQSSNRSYTRSVPKDTDDGLSYETAIVITESGEGKGVAAEYAWIRNHYTGYTIKKQALTSHNKKPFDVITLALSDGKDLPLYFDISNFFGKL